MNIWRIIHNVSGNNMENMFQKAMGDLSGTKLFESMENMAESMEKELKIFQEVLQIQYE